MVSLKIGKFLSEKLGADKNDRPGGKLGNKMDGRLGNKLGDEGFTLAELLISVAIVVIMLAIAIPSILTLQRNLLLDEANKAAEAVANAAQLEMTSMKTDGTWATKVRNDDGSYKNEFPLAVNASQPTGGISSSHMRYMTAQTARDFGIISGSSIDANVRDSSYVIEFNGLTASVTRVYYSSGAVGFFGAHVSSSHADTSVLDYYKGTSVDNDQPSRLSFEGCTIGRFVGTPDGATPSIALMNPSVSANEYGKIVLTNPNMRDAVEGNSAIKELATEVTFTYPISDSEKYSFTISGMTKNYTGDTYTVKASDGANEFTCSFSNAPASNSSVYTVESNSRFELDLNDLAALLEDGTDDAQVAGAWDIVSAIQDASRQDLQSKMEAVCTVSAKDCMPVTGKAFLDWPSKVPTLKVYVTDPDPANTDVEALGLDKSSAVIPSYISGTYESPDVTLVDKSGNPVDPSIISSYTGLISDSMLKASYNLMGVWVNNEAGDAVRLPVKADWFNILQNENVQEGSQSYSGKIVKIDTAKDIDANVLVTVGSYTSNSASTMTITNGNAGTITYSDGSVSRTRTNAFNANEVKWLDSAKDQGFTGQEHDYQIFEVWLDDGVSNHRVGSFQGENWVWDDSDGILSDCVRAAEGGDITENTTQLIVDSKALMSKAGTLSKYQNYSLYVRTAPKSSEALSWLGDHAYELASYVGAVVGSTTDQRGQNYGRPVRWLFENEFGAPTTVAAYTVSTFQQSSSIMEDQGGQFFPLSNTYFRAYYSTLPAVAWNTSSALDSRYLELPNVQMMLCKFTKGKGVERIAFDTGDTLYSHELDSMFQVRATGGADIAILPSFDQQFYRVMTYFDSDGKTRLSDSQLSDKQQYRILPLDGFDSDLRFPVGPQKSGVSFYGWRVTSSSGTFMVTCNEDGVMPYVSDYVDQMKYGNVSLTAQYREGCDEKVGLLYIDDYDDGTYRYTGYANANAAYVDDEPLDSGTLTAALDPGYYISYYVGDSSAPKVDISRSASEWNGKCSVSEASNALVNLGDSRYALYKVDFDQSADSLAYTTVKCQMVGNGFSSIPFYCNSLFGGMVDTDENAAATFGRSTYPWRVYNTDMFPGVFQSSMQETDIAYLRKLLENNNTPHNSTNHYVQMRNLDFASVDGDSLNEWPVAFCGTYDGQGYVITNAEGGFTRAPVSGGSSISKVGTLNASDGQEATGLFPALWGRDGSYPAQISNLVIGVGDYASDASMFGVVSGYAKQAAFSGIEVLGDGARAYFELSGMGQYGTTDVFYASGAIVGRAETCFLFEDCSASNMQFDYVDSKLDISNNRFVFGGLAGVYDSTGKSTGSVPGSLTNLSAENIIFNLDSSLKSGKSSTICMGGLFGRFYMSGQANFDGLGWFVKDVTFANNSPYADSAVYPGVIAGTFGGTPKLYDGICGSEEVNYESGGFAYNLIAVYLTKQSVGSGGLLSGTEWFFMNGKKASDLINEAKKLESAPSTTSDEEDDDSAASASDKAKSKNQDAESSSGADGADSSAADAAESSDSGTADSGQDSSASGAGSGSNASDSASNASASADSSSKVDDAA